LLIRHQSLTPLNTLRTLTQYAQLKWAECMPCVRKEEERRGEGTHGLGGSEDVLDHHLLLLVQLLESQRNLLVLIQVHVLLGGDRRRRISKAKMGTTYVTIARIG